MNADLILVDGVVITMNSSAPFAQAVAMTEDKIVAVGTTSEIRRWIGKKTKTVDLKGKAVMPGFIDSHAHIIWLGFQSSELDLRNVSSIESIQQRLREKVKETKKGKWIFGRGWDQDLLEEKRYPTRLDLDKVAPDNPVFIVRVCGHIGVANSKALEIAGIDEKTAKSLGDYVGRDPKTRELNGLFKEKTVDLIRGVSKPSRKELQKACTIALSEAAKLGLTTVTCITDSPSEIYTLEKLAEEGHLSLRVYAMVPIDSLRQFKNRKVDNPYLKVKCVKMFADGSLGARTAALMEPYADEPSETGILYYTLKQLKELVEEADSSGFQIAVHVIGDKAVEQTVRAFEDALGKERVTKHRHRLEHVSVLNPNLIKRIRSLGLLATIQPHFVVSDFWIIGRLGPERARWTYAFKSLVDTGVPIAGSSDAPVEQLSPLLGVWAAVTRERSPEERLSVMEALRAYTMGGAHSSFEEKVKGSIEVGKYADLIVLSHNPLKVKPDKIKDIKVEMTMVGGRVVYSASG
jgi:predicted amidohydrolase YtcJ